MSNKKIVNVLVRGGIGDFCIASLKFDGIREKHPYDIITLMLVTPDETKREVIELAKMRRFADYIVPFQQYYRQALIIPEVKEFFDNADYQYSLNLWKVGMGSGSLFCIEQIYPDIPCNYYHDFAYFLGGIIDHHTVCIQPYGSSGTGLWTSSEWRALVGTLVEKGIMVVCFGKTNQSDTIINMLANHYSSGYVICEIDCTMNNILRYINRCSMFIGCDSGLKNIALLLNKPTVMVWNPAHVTGKPKEVWFPRHYQFDERNLIVSDSYIDKVKEHIKSVMRV